MMKIGVVDVGGGLRGIYAAGVFDYCMDENIKFDCCIGVSAGSANVASYLSGQRGRNYKFYTDYAFRNQYMGMAPLPALLVPAPKERLFSLRYVGDASHTLHYVRS